MRAQHRHEEKWKENERKKNKKKKKRRGKKPRRNIEMINGVTCTPCDLRTSSVSWSCHISAHNDGLSITRQLLLHHRLVVVLIASAFSEFRFDGFLIGWRFVFT